MDTWTDVATESFLEAARADLQGQLRLAGAVVDLSIEDAPDRVTMIASVRVGGRTTELRGKGENLLTAYADLCRSAPEPILVAAFREYLQA